MSYRLQTLQHLPKNIFLGGLLLVALPASAKITSISEAVNIAGKQRMITQRLLKDYAMIGMNNTYGDPSADLKSMINLFDTNLKELQSYVKDTKSRKSLKTLQVQWEPIKASLQKKPSKNGTLQLLIAMEKLLKIADNTTRLIARTAKKSDAEIVNLSGRQRMLSQRMASLYMLKVWEIDDLKISSKLATAMQEFESAQDKLLNSQHNTPQTKALLLEAQKSYRYFQFMGKSNTKKFIPSLINRSANKILDAMQKSTTIYASL